MKNIFTICMTSFLVLLSFQACTEEELVTINDPLELDENSIQYQQFMEERAIQLIKTYRFDKLGNTIDRIKDPVARERVLALLTEYRTIAFNDALYFAKPNNDTIFFFPPNIEDRKEAKRISFYFTSPGPVVNERGVLHGFKNFPKVESLEFTNSLATGIKDLNTLTELKKFKWEFIPYYFNELNPDIELVPLPLEFDFSQNSKLENLSLNYAEMDNLKFPAHKIQSVGIGYSIIKKAEDIDAIAANTAIIRWSTSEENELVLKSKNIDSLFIDLAGLTSIDISETKLLTFDIMNVEKLKLNEGLKKLKLTATNLTEKPSFPKDLQNLYLTDYKLQDKNLSAITGLKNFTISCPGFDGLTVPTNVEELEFGIPWPYTAEVSSGINQDYSNLTKLKKVTIYNGTIDQAELVFPSNLEYIYFDSPQKMNGIGDYSNISSLKTFMGKYTNFEHAPKLPASLTKLDFFFLTLPSGSTLDISNLTNLNYLRINATTKDTPFTLVLPTNLTEIAVKAGYGGINSARGSIILPAGSTIINAPAWLSQYVHIGNI